MVSEGGTDIIDLTTLKPTVPRDAKGVLKNILNQPAVHVMKDSKGCIWLHCANKLIVCFNEKGDVETVSTLDLVVLNGPNIALQDIDEDGKIWAGINGEILKVDLGLTGKTDNYPNRRMSKIRALELIFPIFL